ncbi:14291_t:CDS:2 [Funneliformis caledonium]|uniref:14291_t:CDS:1 n=1 Tax=Funneliformis caledonium TaxID=1117310 RepID=A0A9N8W2R0_9GLOM|nr:14291_t:CDS:2 [Funneliformis caledonium]
MRKPNHYRKNYVMRSHPYLYNFSTPCNVRNFGTIPEAKRAGAIDRIEKGETKLKLITLFQENMNYIKLTEIPQAYFFRFDRALEYTGKFKYRINDEMPNILTQHESGNGQEIIVRLSEPYQKMKHDVLPTFNRESDNEEIKEKSTKFQVHRNNEQTVKEWLKELRHIDDEKKEDKQEGNNDQKKIKVKEMVNLRIVFDDDDMNSISPLQRDVLEFLFREFHED